MSQIQDPLVAVDSALLAELLADRGEAIDASQAVEDAIRLELSQVNADEVRAECWGDQNAD